MDALEADDQPAEALLELGWRVVPVLVVGIGGLVDGFLEPITDLVQGGGLHPVSHIVCKSGPKVDLAGLEGDREPSWAGDAPGKLKVLEVDARSPDLDRVYGVKDGVVELILIRGRGGGRRRAPTSASTSAGRRAGPPRLVAATTAPKAAFGCLPVAVAAAGISGETTADSSAAARLSGENGSLGRRGWRDLLGVCINNGLEGRQSRLRGLQLRLKIRDNLRLVGRG